MAARRKREEEAEFLKLNTTSNPTELDILTFALHLLDPSCPAQTTAAALLERHGQLSDVFDTPAQILAECPASVPRLASALAAYPDLFRAYMESKKIRRAPVLSIPKPPLPPCRTNFSAENGDRRAAHFGQQGVFKIHGHCQRGLRAWRAHLYPSDCPAVPFVRRRCRLPRAQPPKRQLHALTAGHPNNQREIELALSGIDVILSDHFIFTDEDYLSMRATGVLQKLRHDIATLKRQIIT